MTLVKTTASSASWTVTCPSKSGFTMSVQFPIRYLSNEGNQKALEARHSFPTPSMTPCPVIADPTSVERG
jgi:hypothetical protein